MRSSNGFWIPTVPMSLISPSTTISRRRRCIFRYEVMEKLLLHQYPSLSESFTDHMIELLYAELLKSGHFSKTALLSCSDLWYNRTIKYTIER